jgi:hypothetical protein
VSERVYREREESAQLIWEALVATQSDGGLTRPEIMAACGLTPAQFHYGLGLVRDHFQRRYGQPLAYAPKTKRYSLPEVWEQDRTWVDFRARSLLTQTARVEKNLGAAFERFGDDVPQLRLLHRSMTRIREDVAEIAALSHANGARQS